MIRDKEEVMSEIDGETKQRGKSFNRVGFSVFHQKNLIFRNSVQILAGVVKQYRIRLNQINHETKYSS